MANGLPWFRCDSDIASNPKIAEMIGEHGARAKAAAFVYLAAIGYCAQHLTDGVLQRGALPLVHGSPADARMLVEAGLLAVEGKGWRVVNYEAHQPTRATTEAKSQQAREAAQARWGKERNA